LPTRPRFERLDPPEIAALKRLKHDQPELGVAVDFQVEVLTLQRRLQSRLTTPWIPCSAEWLAARLGTGTPALRFEDVAFDWMELRLLFRQLADLLARYETIEPDDHASLLRLARTSHPTAEEVGAWFSHRASRQGAGDAWVSPHGDAFAQVLELSAKPFVERASESLRTRLDFAEWRRPYCPVCGSDPEMATLTVHGDRLLHCGSCSSAWEFSADVCPSCANPDKRRLPTYASPDGRYRLLACDVCRHYLKAIDGRYAERPLMLAVDSIATLPLDAAAMKQGYLG